MASLGTLTLDIIAKTSSFVKGMDDVGKSVTNFESKAQKAFRNFAKVSGAAFGTGAAALGLYTKKTVDAAREIQKFARLAGASTKEFQQYAGAAQAVGIQQGKFADILKDTNDKVGEFLATGGGPLKQFFEEVAPQVGVTAEQFRNLSGPDALKLFVKTLQEAGASQQDFTTYLEGISSEAVVLLPLLQDNAEAFETLAGATSFVDEESIKAANELQAALFLLEQDASNFTKELTDGLTPTLAVLAGALTGVSDDAGDAVDDVNLLANALAAAAVPAIALSAGLEFIGTTVGGAIAQASLYLQGEREAAAAVSREFEADIFALGERYEKLFSDLFTAANGGGTGSENRPDRLQDIIDAFEKIRAGASSGGGIEKAADGLQEINVQAEKLPDTIADWLDPILAYEKVVKELRTDEEVLNDTLRERLAIIDAVNIANKGEQQRRAISGAFGDSPSFGGLDAAVGGATSELMRIDEAREQLESWYSEQLDRLDEFRKERADLQEYWDEQEVALAQEREDKLLKIEKARQLASLVAAETAFGDLADVVKTFAGEQSTAYKALFALEKAAAIARSIIAIQTAIAQASTAGPFPANLVAMASVASATAGLISTIASTSIQGQAHDGLMSVPKTGTYILERGERVTTAATSAKMDSMIDEARQGGGSKGVRIINAWDTSMIGDYIGSSQGEQIVMNTIRKNQRTIRALAAV